MADQLRNPITNEPVDEIIKQDEAEKRGYFDFQFMLKNLEDENEFVKFFIVNGKKIIVDIKKPNLEYKKPPLLNHARILDDMTGRVASAGNAVAACGLDDEGCISCSG